MASPNWNEEARIPLGTNRENIYELAPTDFDNYRIEGLKHASKWPVAVTGLLLPYEPIRGVVEGENDHPLVKLILKLTERKYRFKNMDEFYEWLGLPLYNSPQETGKFHIPRPDDLPHEIKRMGIGVLNTDRGKALTFSCFACHSQNLFGKTIVGLTNKNSRTNQLFHLAKKTVPFIPNYLFQSLTDATDLERKQFHRTKKNLSFVASKLPLVLGLDTSLAQVGLSLSMREKNAYATRSVRSRRRPRPNRLNHFAADSKPAVWWNVKHKTRWLSDGSLVSGNPILTNFLWNEIGRGVDLKELEKWLQENREIVKELTAAVFATRPPRWHEIFPERKIDLLSAKRGQKIFRQSCQKCHGRYRKAWELPGSAELSLTDKTETIAISYHEQTPIKDVGTDSSRYQGMRYFARDLNRLAISKWMKARIVPTNGYVPPPLEGIWARYPYLHNNSIPSLCALMSAPKNRPKVFYQGPSKNKKTDYDFDCIGYPVGNHVPHSWRTEEQKFDTRRQGLSNKGHYKMFLDEDGKEKFNSRDKRDLIEFLKTL